MRERKTHAFACIWGTFYGDALSVNVRALEAYWSAPRNLQATQVAKTATILPPHPVPTLTPGVHPP
jgi:hypothetical protein